VTNYGILCTQTKQDALWLMFRKALMFSLIGML